MEVRLQKFLAEAGVASRRKAEEYILDGRVKVNGVTVRLMGVKVDGKKDIIEFDGKVVSKDSEHVYIMLNKPEGYVTTVKDQFSRPAVMDLVSGIKHRIFPVGRLDYETSGLLLMTNDGDIAYKLTHPAHSIEKTYEAKLYGSPDINDIRRFKRGLDIEGGKTLPAFIEIIEAGEKFCTVRIKITEGRNRQVRKMCDAIKHPVATLKRTAVAGIELGDLKKGKYRHLTDKEVRYLKSL